MKPADLSDQTELTHNPEQQKEAIKKETDRLFASLDNPNITLDDLHELVDKFASNNPEFAKAFSEFQDMTSCRVIEMLKSTGESESTLENNSHFDYFWIDKEQVWEILIWLKELDLNIEQILIWCKEYIENNLDWLTIAQKDKIILAISNRISKIGDIITYLKWKTDNWEDFKNNRWIANEEILDELWFIIKELFPSLEAYLKIKSWIKVSKIHEEQYLDPLHARKNSDFVDTEFKISEIEELLQADVNIDWEFDEWLFSRQDIFDFDNEANANLLAELWVQELDLSLLNDKDKQIEEEATLYFMAMIWIQIWVETAWWLVWSIVWWWIDIADTFSDNEQLLNIVQWLWLADNEYKMNKGWLDKILAWMWILPWMTQIIKWSKLAKFLKKIPRERFDKAIERVKKSLWIWNEKVSKKEIWKLENLWPSAYEKHPFLKEYKEILWDIRESDIISEEWKNAIIIRNLTNDNEVFKIARSEWEKDSLIREFDNHNRFYNAWLEWRASWKIDKKIIVPYVKEWYNDSIIKMERIKWQSLDAKSLLKHFEKEFKDYKQKTDINLNSLTDSEIINILSEVYWKSKNEIIDWKNMYGWDMLKDIIWESKKHYDEYWKKWGTIFDIAEKYISWEHKLLHDDLHPWNILLDNEGNIYLIDYWRVTIFN